MNMSHRVLRRRSASPNALSSPGAAKSPRINVLAAVRKYPRHAPDFHDSGDWTVGLLAPTRSKIGT